MKPYSAFNLHSISVGTSVPHVCGHGSRTECQVSVPGEKSRDSLEDASAKKEGSDLMFNRGRT